MNVTATITPSAAASCRWCGQPIRLVTAGDRTVWIHSGPGGAFPCRDPLCGMCLPTQAAPSTAPVDRPASAPARGPYRATGRHHLPSIPHTLRYPRPTGPVPGPRRPLQPSTYPRRPGPASSGAGPVLTFRAAPSRCSWTTRRRGLRALLRRRPTRQHTLHRLATITADQQRDKPRPTRRQEAPRYRRGLRLDPAPWPLSGTTAGGR